MTLPTGFFGTMDGTSPASIRRDKNAVTGIDMGLRQQILKVHRKKFGGIVTNLLQSKPMKREDVRVSKRKPEKLISTAESVEIQ
jgi:hypothetical protein